MPTRSPRSFLAHFSSTVGVVVALSLFPSPVSSQFPSFLLDEETEVRSIRFRFLDSETFSRSRLLSQIGLTEQGTRHGLKKSLAVLPFFSEPGSHPFDPINLQRDVARLREFYRGAGFPEAHIRYEVALDQDRNLVEVEFLITEGRPRTLISVVYSDSSGSPVEEALAAEIVPGWQEFVAGEKTLVGERFGDLERTRLEGNPLQWLMERGYPFPTSVSGQRVDSTGFQTQLTVRIQPGPRSRVGSVEVEGVTSVDDAVALREIPIREGDWFSASQVNEGRRRIFRLDLFRIALTQVAPLPQPDSSVQVLFRVQEARSRSVSGLLGYTNVGGIAVGGQWEHRNFMGGARTFAVSGTAETGALALLTESPDEYFRAALSLRQPFVFVSGLSFVASPFGEYRDDYRDRSWEAGMDGTLVYQYAPLRAVSLRYRLSTREVLEYRVGEVSTGTGELLGSTVVADSLEPRMVVSAFTLSATLGRLDDPANPRRGFIVQPSLEVTAPLGLPTNEYLKVDLWGSFYQNLGERIRLAGTLRAGRLFPFGGSVPSSGDDGVLEFIQLRDVNLMAGGPNDVRGWGSRLMGPKIPDPEIHISESDTTYTASRYLPLGGLARVSGALEIQFPIPRFGSEIRGHVFLDGGRVWTPDDRYLHTDDPYDQDKVYYSAGGGVGIETPLGPIRVSVGYKLNPSPLDLRDPGEVLNAFLEERPILDEKTNEWRRVRLHLTVGRVF
jgi:outer membrane protein insertion porin family